MAPTDGRENPMKVKYISEINAFYNELEIKPLSSSAIALWHALLHLNNRCGWKDSFSVPVGTLSLKSGLSERSISNARNELKTKGYIDFQSRGGNKSAVYQMKRLSANFADNLSDNASDNLSDSVSDNASDNLSALYRYRQDIDKDKNNNSSRRKQVYDKDSVPYRAASYLLAKIKENKPDFKDPNLQKWADDMRKLMEIDKRDVHEVAKVIDWVSQDDFWSTVILSPANLRKKWDQITLRMMKSHPVKKIVAGGENIAINVQHHGYDSREDQPYPSITGGKVGRLNRKSVSMP